MSEWMPWDGRACPVPPDTLVHFRLDNGRLEHFEMAAGKVQWDNSRRQIKLAAYRIVDPQP